MTRLKTKVYGKPKELLQTPAHFLRSALNQFLIAEFPDTVLASLIHLSIGLEILIKEYLHRKHPHLITVKRKKWNQIEARALTKTSKAEQRKIILSEMNALSPPQNSRTITFEEAIKIFPYFYRVRKQNLNDLNNLRDYRNGLFHWTTQDSYSFAIAKQALRLFQWMFSFLESRIGHWLGAELNVIDPMGSNRKHLDQLRQCIRSENAFNLQRRIFKHHKMYETLYQAQARLDGTINIPDAVPWPQQPCPACNTTKLQLYESGTRHIGKWVERYVFAHCILCDFHCSHLEFDSIKSAGTPSLIKVFEKLRKR